MKGLVEMITAKYLVNGSILVVDEDRSIMPVEVCTVPDDMLNRDRRRLADWEKSGGVIQPFVKPPPTADEIRTAEFKALPERIDIVQRLRNSTPAQIDTWLTNNVTNLAQARAVLGAIIKYLAVRNGD